MNNPQRKDLWRNTANLEGASHPPAAGLQIAKEAIATSNLLFRRSEGYLLPELLFDSFLQRVVTRARSAGSGTRQLLYRVDSYQIDLQIETGSDPRMLLITGQLLDLKRPEFSDRDVLVVISNLRGQVVLAIADQFGEFRKEIGDSGDLELFFLGFADHPFTIAIGNPLRRLSKEEGPRLVAETELRNKTGKKT